MKKKLTNLTKAKMTFCFTYGIFVIVFLVLGILKVTGVIVTSDFKKTLFNWVTIFGGSWVIVDFFWTLISKKRREKHSILDKAMNLPLGIYVVTFDILCFCGAYGADSTNFYRYGLSIVYFYIVLDYGFQCIFRWFNPNKEILDTAKELDLADEEEANKDKKDDQKSEDLDKKEENK